MSTGEVEVQNEEDSKDEITPTSKEESSDEITPTTPHELYDITLVVGEQKLYTSRLILSCVSPVWRTMFSSNFKEKLISEIPLPEKGYQAVLELLYCIMPGVKKAVTRKANLYLNIIIFNKCRL